MFSFVNDNSQSYNHDYDTYRAIVTNRVFDGVRRYVVETSGV